MPILRVCDRTQAHPVARQDASHLLKQGELHGIGRMIRFIGAGQMAHDAFKVQSIQLLAIVDEDTYIGFAEAAPGHTGVDLQDGGQLLARCQGGAGPSAHLIETVENRYEIMSDEVGFRTSQRTMEERNRRAGSKNVAERNPLLQIGDKEVPASGSCQRGGNLCCTQSVSIGFDDSRADSRWAFS